MAKIVLDGAQIGTFVGQVVAAGVTQGVRMNIGKPCISRRPPNQVEDAGPLLLLTSL